MRQEPARWDQPGLSPRVRGVVACLVPGLALALPGKPWAAVPWVLTSAAVTALLSWLALSGLVWPVAVLFLLPAWLVAAPLAVRSAASDTPAPGPGPGALVTLALLHWVPAMAVVAILIPTWSLVVANQAASSPMLWSGEVAACRDGPSDAVPTRGALVVAGAEDQDARFIGRVLGLPGERVEPAAGTWLLDGVPAVRSVRDLLIAADDHGDEGTNSLVYRVGRGYLSLWSRGPVDAAVGSGAPVDLASDQVYVLALDHHAGAALDSRGRGPFSLEQVSAARCVLLWSRHRPARIGSSLP